ncbi:MAG: rhodanese-like domain-containing protein [Rhodobacteraceae bacterium]|nr:rhodanese-like domain-containing protein [Paracoccaceae bacterium]
MKQVFLDVRSREEHLSDGIDGSLNIPHNTIMNNLQQLPEGREILIYCHSGTKSAIVAMVLEKLGYNVMNIETIDMAKNIFGNRYE